MFVFGRFHVCIQANSAQKVALGSRAKHVPQAHSAIKDEKMAQLRHLK